jgi:hypothetical protein
MQVLLCLELKNTFLIKPLLKGAVRNTTAIGYASVNSSNSSVGNTSVTSWLLGEFRLQTDVIKIQMVP